MKVTTGIVKANKDIGGWLIELDDGTCKILINKHDWPDTRLSAGKRLRFQMVHGPMGIYALPVKVRRRGELDSE